MTPCERLFMIGLVIITLLLLAIGDHDAANPLFQELRTKGFFVAGDMHPALPAPSMPDGLDTAAQQAALAKIVGERYRVDEFVRDSVVAPFVLKFPNVRGDAITARGIDVWFIVHGDLNELSKVDVLKEFTSSRADDAKLHVLTAAELEARRLPATSADSPQHIANPGDSEERFAYTVATILERVELHQTLRCVLSRTTESVVIASLIDRRFDGDKEFPNLYHRLIRDDNGDTTKGPAKPYAGAGGYMKATQLAQPKGAILVEYHSIYSEPRDWFNGANLLQSKLPILLQSRVRELRRDVKAARK
jgi:hypothetical protein